jgi:hypothetical protein
MKGKIFDGVEESLLLAKTSVEKENQNMVPICCSGGPLNSPFIRCSRTHITKPVKMNAPKVANQRSKLRGFKKIQKLFLSLSLIKTTIDTPDSEYGKVKSTYVDRFATIVVSPTTASYFCILTEGWSIVNLRTLTKKKKMTDKDNIV